MERSLLIATVLALPLAAFGVHVLLQLRRGQIYRADNLVRAELNQMHLHTVWSVLMCALMLVGAVFIPSTRLWLGLSASLMLFVILPLRTIFIEMGIRYNRNGIPKSLARNTMEIVPRNNADSPQFRWLDYFAQNITPRNGVSANVRRSRHMPNYDRSTAPLIVAMLAIMFTAACIFLARGYRADSVELDRISEDIQRAELMVEHVRSSKDELTPEEVRDTEQQIARLSDRVSELKSEGPESRPARTLELLAFCGMIVSIVGNGLFIYRKATT